MGEFDLNINRLSQETTLRPKSRSLYTEPLTFNLHNEHLSMCTLSIKVFNKIPTSSEKGLLLGYVVLGDEERNPHQSVEQWTQIANAKENLTISHWQPLHKDVISRKSSDAFNLGD